MKFVKNWAKIFYEMSWDDRIVYVATIMLVIALCGAGTICIISILRTWPWIWMPVLATFIIVKLFLKIGKTEHDRGES